MYGAHVRRTAYMCDVSNMLKTTRMYAVHVRPCKHRLSNRAKFTKAGGPSCVLPSLLIDVWYGIRFEIGASQSHILQFLQFLASNFTERLITGNIEEMQN